jgi:hypothetical protein
MRFQQLLARVLGLCVSGYFAVQNFRINIYYQAFPPANAIFVGIGVLLVVGILHVSLAQTILNVDTRAPRLLKMRGLAKKG